MENRTKLNGKDFEVLGNILAFIKDNGFSPTFRELAEMLGYNSTSTVHRYLQRLQDAGVITYEPTKPRTIAITANVHVNFGH